LGHTRPPKSRSHRLPLAEPPLHSPRRRLPFVAAPEVLIVGSASALAAPRRNYWGGDALWVGLRLRGAACPATPGKPSRLLADIAGSEFATIPSGSVGCTILGRSRQLHEVKVSPTSDKRWIAGSQRAVIAPPRQVNSWPGSPHRPRMLGVLSPAEPSAHHSAANARTCAASAAGAAP
jgi:hypothetical protein